MIEIAAAVVLIAAFWSGMIVLSHPVVGLVLASIAFIGMFWILEAIL